MIDHLEDRRLFAISLTAGKLNITGTDANDTIRVRQITSAILEVSFNGVQTTYNDSLVETILINGKKGSDTLTIVTPQVPGSQVVTESATLLGDSGNDTITGGSGNDLINGGSGFNVLDGGAGTDTADYSGFLGYYYLSVSLDNIANDNLTERLGASYLTICSDNVKDSVENIIGGAGPDTILGSKTKNTNNLFYGNGGNDRLLGYGGNDTLKGGDGNDVISGGDGNDTITGGNGNDVLQGNNGNDNIVGDAGDDYLEGGIGADILNGGLGDDFINAVDGAKDLELSSGGLEGFDILQRDSTDPFGNPTGFDLYI